jgi:hypothetical protein
LDIKEIQGDVQNTRKGYKKNAFTLKLTRKTLGTYIDETEGIEMASHLPRRLARKEIIVSSWTMITRQERCFFTLREKRVQ